MIPKAKGGERALGIPTVADRVAQMVVKNRLEPLMDPLFHPNSFGYRPGKSALDAVGWARQRCWSFDWVCDLDIKGFFANIDHDRMMKAVRKHVNERWIVLYMERWLKAPAQDQEGNQTARERGTPQGGVISPLLANLFLHYTFDLWMLKKWKHLPFEPKLRGWLNYYGRFNPSELRPIERHVGQSLVRWACRKYKTLFHHRTRAWAWLLRVVNRQPDLLALWEQQRWAVSTIGAV